MQKTRTLIVEDDNSAADLLKMIIEEHFNNIEIIAFTNNIQDSIDVIESEKPELVLLDMELPDGYGFEVLEKVQYRNFEFVCITAHNKYAIKAFELSALHYLLKPVTYESLKVAFERFKHNANFKILNKRIEVLKNNLTQENNKIMLPTGNGLEIFNLDEIIRFEADDNYSIIYFNGNRKYMIVTKTLSVLDSALSDCGFFRVHRKYLVNMKYLKKFVKNRRNPSLILTDGAEIPIADSKYNDFIETLAQTVKLI